MFRTEREGGTVQYEITHGWVQLLHILRSILDALDAADVPPRVGAHVDLAICRLEEELASRRAAETTNLAFPNRQRVAPFQDRRSRLE